MIAGICKKHDAPNEMRDVGRGKWVPVCPICEEECRRLIEAVFKDSFKK